MKDFETFLIEKKDYPKQIETAIYDECHNNVCNAEYPEVLLGERCEKTVLYNSEDEPYDSHWDVKLTFCNQKDEVHLVNLSFSDSLQLDSTRRQDIIVPRDYLKGLVA